MVHLHPSVAAFVFCVVASHLFASLLQFCFRVWRLLQLVCCMFFGSSLLTICLCASWLRPLFVHTGRWLCTFPVRPFRILTFCLFALVVLVAHVDCD